MGKTITAQATAAHSSAVSKISYLCSFPAFAADILPHMKPMLPIRSVSTGVTLLLASTLACATALVAQPQGNPAPGSYQGRPQPATPRTYPTGSSYGNRAPSGYPGSPNRPAPQQGYAYHQAPQPGNNPAPRYGYNQAPRYGYEQPQNRYGNAPRGYGYGQSQGAPYPQPQGEPMPGYAQGSGFQQQPNAPTTGSVPNRNANYSGMSPQQAQRQNPQQRFWQQQNDGTGPNATRGEHLQQWMASHNALNPRDQQRALEREPGFNQLPQQTQQRMLDRLQRLNSMAPEQRERVLTRSEQMERLSPVQRGEVRSAMGELGALPQDRRRAVAHTFRELRPMSPEQRNQILNSPEYRQQFNDQERSTLNNLLNVSPMLPQQ